MAESPLFVRANILGLIISTIGVLCWSVVATVIPLPWSFIIMLYLLWVFWKYFSGSWAPESTKAFRKENFRSTKLPKGAWVPALLAGLLIVAIEQSGLIVTFRLMEFPAEQFASAYSFLDGFPLWAAWMVVIMISIVAGVCEEVGYRGYIQYPLEKKHGPVFAIASVSVIFVLVHLHQAWSGPIIAHIFFISVLFGTIAYYSDSLIPGIIAHIIMDIFNFSFWWTKIGWQFDKKPVSVTGIDNHFISWAVILILSIILFFKAIAKLKTIHRHVDV